MSIINIDFLKPERPEEYVTFESFAKRHDAVIVTKYEPTVNAMKYTFYYKREDIEWTYMMPYAEVTDCTVPELLEDRICAKALEFLNTMV